MIVTDYTEIGASLNVRADPRPIAIEGACFTTLAVVCAHRS